MQSTWIFQLANPLESEQATEVKDSVKSFLQEWNAHGTPVPGKVDLPYNHFITIEAEPGATSGCSIDKMTRTVTGIVEASGNAIMGPQQIFYRKEDGSIGRVDFRDVDAAIASGELHPETTVFDSSMDQSSDLGKWERKLKDTWLNRYL